MFTSARIKLTAWYLLIIMSVSLLFSLFIYNGIDREFGRIQRISEMRTEEEQRLGIIVPRQQIERATMLVQARERLALALILANLAILSASGFLGYFLAGRTLRPIEDMIDEQNRFITDSSHELRTPLTALKTSIEVNLRDRRLTLDKAKALLKSNLEEVNSLNLLSDELIRLVQFQQPNTSPSLDNIDLKEVIDRAVRNVEPITKQKKIEISSSLEGAEIKADEKSMNELITIFLDNAVKYSSINSKITITSKVKNNNAEITVADTGPGIDKEHIPHIFERFYRAEKSRTKDKAHGYGLGLSIAKKIVDVHHGSISVDSEKGKGTTFKISLPLS